MLRLLNFFIWNLYLLNLRLFFCLQFFFFNWLRLCLALSLLRFLSLLFFHNLLNFLFWRFPWWFSGSIFCNFLFFSCTCKFLLLLQLPLFNLAIPFFLSFLARLNLNFGYTFLIISVTFAKNLFLHAFGLLLCILLLLFTLLSGFDRAFFFSLSRSLDGFYAICKFTKLCDEEAVHVVDVWVNTLAQLGTRVEALLLIGGEPVYADFQTGFYQFYMSVLQSIVDNPFILLDRNGAGWVPTFKLKKIVLTQCSLLFYCEHRHSQWLRE